MNLESIFANMMKAVPARRGRLFEQYYTRTGSDGTERRIGPYYVLTRSVNGKTVSERVRREDAPRVREDLARGETLAGLVEKLWAAAEGTAGAGRVKKNSSARSKALRPHSSRKP